ncbi:phosphoribosylformylglycinamidine cyclo-ligase [Brachyspira murdochii]|uniref:Phosphoribosylformylglycinamidine cyclo-ligase n=1 Tax=Brachyspira murdochii TaxID=84378 RepID=A0ABX5B1L7_9SPIR|nr:phosphoribosylformylglycinamidine cyclo-ligase [Brachyspira murdochii]PPS21119.1 phosphoribosylaminoimidazole synthetase [Brachyspira murdochii]
MSISYADSGVNREEGYKAVSLMKEVVAKTMHSNVLNTIGSFGAMYELGKYNNPVLVSGTDGVGTKLEIAFSMKKYDTVGIDAVAMCVNDVLCHGAKPIFFLDYLACGKLNGETASLIVKGIADGCYEAGAALIGGETAEMPGFYKEGDYDIAGFCVGVVEKDKIIDGANVAEDDAVIGISSSGFHSNGFSLIRKLVRDYNAVFEGEKIGETLLVPTKIYVKKVLPLLEKYNIKGMAHITGGGLIENVPRAIAKGYKAVIKKDSFQTPNIFNYIRYLGNIKEEEMYNTFNMGIGFVIIASKDDKDNIIRDLEAMNEEAYDIGYITKNEDEGKSGICLE